MGLLKILQINKQSVLWAYVCEVADIGVIFGKYHEQWLTFSDPMNLEYLFVRESNKFGAKLCHLYIIPGTLGVGKTCYW